MTSFDTEFDALPGEMPIFPLPRVILLPRVQLPLNIFEPRYLALVQHAMKTDRLIGMVQCKSGEEVFKTGCAGRIVNFTETDDGRFLITLRGVARFDIRSEMPLDAAGFRMVQPDWSAYKNDFIEEAKTDLCRETMVGNLRAYLDKMNMFCDQWEQVRNISCDKLISILSVVCPFGIEEKQALLEAKNVKHRADILQAYLKIAAADLPHAGQTTCH